MRILPVAITLLSTAALASANTTEASSSSTREHLLRLRKRILNPGHKPHHGGGGKHHPHKQTNPVDQYIQDAVLNGSSPISNSEAYVVSEKVPHTNSAAEPTSNSETYMSNLEAYALSSENTRQFFTTENDACQFCPDGMTQDASYALPTNDGGTCGSAMEYAETLKATDEEMCSTIKLAEAICCPQSSEASAPLVFPAQEEASDTPVTITATNDDEDTADTSVTITATNDNEDDVATDDASITATPDTQQAETTETETVTETDATENPVIGLVSKAAKQYFAPKSDKSSTKSSNMSMPKLSMPQAKMHKNPLAKVHKSTSDSSVTQDVIETLTHPKSGKAFGGKSSKATTNGDMSMHPVEKGTDMMKSPSSKSAKTTSAKAHKVFKEVVDTKAKKVTSSKAEKMSVDMKVESKVSKKMSSNEKQRR